MRKSSGMKSVIFLYLVFILLLIGAVLAAALYMTHITTIVRPDGTLSRSNWPQQYADSFAGHISVKNEVPEISPDGQAYLEKYRSWIQILDEQGRQISAYNKPPEAPENYSLPELLDLTATGRLNEYTVSVVQFTAAGQNYEYIIGFPIDITKTTMYFNSDRFTGGRTVFFTVLAGLCLLVLAAGLIYGIWLTRHVSRIVRSAGEIAARTYRTEPAKGVFGDAYRSLNKLDAEIRSSDMQRAETEQLQEEWLTNITHDLKTPLSPIRGYAELLAAPDGSLSSEDRIRYGTVILRNTEYAEKLVNDLKLTYQLKNNMFPLQVRQASLSRFLRETVIEILNHPEYADRKIVFADADREVFFCFDEALLKRAIDNLIYNALIHNAPKTRVNISLSADEHIKVAVTDSGAGMNADQLERLFERYYRGTNTAAAAGTGLGMAIAKQIIEIHDGTIHVDSSPGEGTRIEIDFPLQN